MAIIGESFKPYVRTQINIRQDKLALRVKDDDTLKYITSKTSFLRLTSGVNIDKEIAKNLGVPNLEGNGLAKQYVLEAARFKSDPNNANSDFTSGVGYTSGDFGNNFTTSYGFNSDINFGLVPPPGLISATVNTLNRGTIREATISLVCHNLHQFKIINALFLKLKYSLLLEWGHTLYFDNGTKDNPTPSFVRPISIPNLSNDFLNRKGMSSDDILKEIENKREESCGNYDAFFGVIKNFNWELSENGSYNITINAISQGSVIESLKINSNLTPNENISGENPLYQKSTLHYILGKIREKILSGTGGSGGGNYLHGYITAAGEVGLNSVNVSNFTNVKINNKNKLDTNSTSAGANNILTNQEGLAATFPNLQTYVESNTGQSQFYIKLGTLLRLMESFLLYYDTTKDSNPSMFHFNYNFITGNDCVTIPHHISIDPLTCLIPLDYENNTDPPTSVVYNINTTTHTITLDKDFKIVSSTFTTAASADSTGWPDSSVDESLENQELVLSTADSLGNPLSSATFRIIPNKTLYSDVYSRLSATPDIFSLPSNPNGQNITIVTKTISPVTRYNINTQDQAGNLRYMSSEFRSGNPYIGKTMHIHVNIGKIIDILDRNVDDEGNISVHSFLTQLLSDIKYALGGINKFDLNYDSITNTFSIIDTAVIPYKYQNLNKKDIAKFNINLLKIPDNNGGSFVTNFSLKSEVFSKVANAIAIGAQDNGNRMLANSTPLSNFNKGLTDRIITNKENINTQNFKLDQGFDQFTEAFAKYYQYKRKLVNAANEGINENDINLYRNYLVDLFNYDLGTYTSNGVIPGTGFIPLNLQLTMDGLSGITQYQTFEIDETLLPDEYKNRLGFITTTISHKIDSKGWETTINSLGVPKKFGKETKVVSSPPPKVTESPRKNTTVVVSGGKQSFSGTTREPRSIILHYTDYPDTPQGVAKAVRSHGKGFGIHHVVGRDGTVFSDIPEDKKSYHGDYWNPFGIGIEIENNGSVIPISEQAKRGYKGPKPKDANAAFYENVYNPAPGKYKGERYFTANEVATLDFKYGGKQYFVEYTDVQINALENLIRNILSRWPGINNNIQGNNLWEWVFGFHGSTLQNGRPIAGKTYTSLTAGTSDKYRNGKLQDTEYDYTLKMLGGTGGYLGPKGYNVGGFNVQGGLYSHATGGGSHFDVAPTPKMVAMLVRLGYRNGY